MSAKSIEQFPLAWRWTEDGQTRLTPDELARIVPVNTILSQALWERSLAFSDSGTEFRPSQDIFADIDVLDTPHEMDGTREWLRKKLGGTSLIEMKVWVSWQPDWAVETDVELFIQYWDSFCYKASDDTSVFPESEQWVLHFWHEDRLYHAMRKAEAESF